MGADGWVCRLLCAVHQTLSLGPCAVSVNGAAGHNRWGVVEKWLPAKTQGRTVDCSFHSVGCPLRPAGRHHAKSSCESRDSCFRMREKYSRVKAGTLCLNKGV